ncbi:protein-L-isoaspartate O-methyltransferase [Plasmodium inui San Antonio 1]|uniref:protein-L-isoaspartate(D-aspartate) O-methyltransferase n=1 Tax=Plasmodium inui San Antonio 1 TaxID=1237626 RepID=W7ABI2_9APIC|nr:protein-L-isoaspartate O-methyltransferase [Plasmodium inui San Antonio 1]EUD66459.1 protein-L-isoaspartate O-methyltransferase [Plasmodium inui San Antonio 1]
MHCSLFNLFIYKTLLCKAIYTSKKLTSELRATKLFFFEPLCKEKNLFSRRLNSAKDNYFIKGKSAEKTGTRNMYTLAGNSHKSLIDSLKERGIIDDEDVYETMLQVDRGKYIKEKPYVDTPVYISHGVTISSPHMHALSLKRLMDVLKPGSRAIDVGSGSGYLTVCMAIRTKVLENKDSFVIGLERVKDVANFSIENIRRDKPELLHLDNFKIIHKNIYQVSEEEKEQLGLFDAIHVGASASELPQILIDLLAENGKLIIPLDEGYTQVLYEITKTNGKIVKDRLFDVCFVTLKKN